MAKLESPRSQGRQRSFCATTVAPPPMLEALSIDLEKTQMPPNEMPFCRRLRTRKEPAWRMDEPADDCHKNGCTPAMRNPLGSRLGARTISRSVPLAAA